MLVDGLEMGYAPLLDVSERVEVRDGGLQRRLDTPEPGVSRLERRGRDPLEEAASIGVARHPGPGERLREPQELRHEMKVRDLPKEVGDGAESGIRAQRLEARLSSRRESVRSSVPGRSRTRASSFQARSSVMCVARTPVVS